MKISKYIISIDSSITISKNSSKYYDTNSKRIKIGKREGKVSIKSLFRNKRFALSEMFQRNASKFAVFYV